MRVVVFGCGFICGSDAFEGSRVAVLVAAPLENDYDNAIIIIVIVGRSDSESQRNGNYV